MSFWSIPLKTTARILTISFSFWLFQIFLWQESILGYYLYFYNVYGASSFYKKVKKINKMNQKKKTNTFVMFPVFLVYETTIFEPHGMIRSRIVCFGSSSQSCKYLCWITFIWQLISHCLHSWDLIKDSDSYRAIVEIYLFDINHGISLICHLNTFERFYNSALLDCHTILGKHM